MKPSHSVVWLDHLGAVLISLNGEEHSIQKIKSGSTESHLHHRRGAVGSGHAASDTHFFGAVTAALNSVPEILVAGPGSAKLELIKYIHKHHHDLVDRVIGIETVDHPTEGQLLKFARDYFVAADRMLPGTGIPMPPK